MNHSLFATGELGSAPLRAAYLRALAVLVAAITVGALVGAWLVWDYPVDGSTGSLIRGQAPIFVCAALAGALPLVRAVRARRRWMLMRTHPDAA